MAIRQLTALWMMCMVGRSGAQVDATVEGPRPKLKTDSWAISVRKTDEPGSGSGFRFWVGAKNVSDTNRVVCLPMVVTYSIRKASGEERGESAAGLSPHECPREGVTPGAAVLVDAGSTIHTSVVVPTSLLSWAAADDTLAFDLAVIELESTPPFRRRGVVRLEWEGKAQPTSR